MQGTAGVPSHMHHQAIPSHVHHQAIPSRMPPSGCPTPHSSFHTTHASFHTPHAHSLSRMHPQAVPFLLLRQPAVLYAPQAVRSLLVPAGVQRTAEAVAACANMMSHVHALWAVSFTHAHTCTHARSAL